MRRKKLFWNLSLSLALCLGPASFAAELLDVPRPAPGAVEDSVAEQIKKAHESLNRLLAGNAADREKAISYGELGQIYAVYELWDAAHACFANAATLDPEGFDGVYLLGWTQQRRGELEAALAHFQQAAAISPTMPATWVRLGQISIELDQPDAASRAFGKALELQPSAAAHFGLGRVAALRGEHAEAVEHFKKTLEFQPSAASVRYPLALALRELGKNNEAREQIALRGEEEPTFPDPLVSALAAKAEGGAFYKFQGDQAVLGGDLRGAMQAYKQAVSANPENFYYRKSLGLTLYHLGDRAGSRTQFEAGLRHLDDVPDNEVAQTHFTLGSIAANERREDDARRHFQQALEYHDHAPAALQLGNLAGRAGDRERALQRFGEALELDPELSEARLHRATTLMDLGRFAEALSDLEFLLRQDPGNERLKWLLQTARERSASQNSP